jgi:hypothetical protein
MQWFEGKHELIMDDQLYEACQAVRATLVKRRKTRQQTRTYILSDRVFCAHCVSQDREHLADPRFGKMRISWHNREGVAHYRCISRDRGYGACRQPHVSERIVLDQLVDVLSDLSQVDGSVAARIEAAVTGRPSNEEALQQVRTLQRKDRVQTSYEFSKITLEEWLKKTDQLEREIASLRPLDYDRLEEAADLITHFKAYWDQCDEVDDPKEARRQLMSQIIDRVFVYDDRVRAVALHPDFGIILDIPKAAPRRVISSVSQNDKRHNHPNGELYPERERRGSFTLWELAIGPHPTICRERRSVGRGLVRLSEGYSRLTLAPTWFET